MIAALYVRPDGPYARMPGVDLWPEDRDARLYAGPWPVVAHPPCSRWCRLAGLVEARWGHKRGDDGGCFAAALAAVRRWGGVLEHPADSAAWKAFGLMAPPRAGGWITAGDWKGWTCCVEQGHYGHAARKATWLYVAGVDALPSLRWGPVSAASVQANVSYCRNRRWAGEDRPRLSRMSASDTPAAFRDLLLDLARTAKLKPVEHMAHRERELTPEPSARLLVEIARSAQPTERAVSNTA